MLKKKSSNQETQSEENKTKNRILEKASELFLDYGYSRVTMDEICRSLVMSRKTMYKYFSNKEDLLREVLINRSKCKGMALDNILQDETMDFMSKFRKMIEYISKENPRERIHFMHDVKTNAPNVWQELVKKRNEDIPIRMRNFIKVGIKQGIVKKNINTELFTRMYLGIVNELMNPEVLLELGYGVGEIIEEVDSVLFFGILDQESLSNKKSQSKKK